MSVLPNMSSMIHREEGAGFVDSLGISELIMPSKVLSEEQRERFITKSNQSQILRDCRELGILWKYTEAFRDRSISQLPDLLIQLKYSILPIYSYGCSSGQEPYSLHLVLRKQFGQDYDSRFPITAYDRDASCIEMARSGQIVIEGSKDSHELVQLLKSAPGEIQVTLRSDYRRSAAIPDFKKVKFVKGDLRQQRFEFSQPVATFMQNVLYHLSFDEQFCVMDNLCQMPVGSLLCLGTDTFTDRAIASILTTSGAFSRIGALKNVLIRDQYGQARLSLERGLV